MKKLLVLCLMLAGCISQPDGIEPVSEFQLSRYLGRWYEIARLPHSFEEGMSQVTADYSLRDDGGVKVINRGYLAEDAEWDQAEGKAYFVNSPDEGYLKVSFFGPFYGSYIIFELDQQNYRYSFVTSNNREYLWLLARTPTVSQAVIDRFLARADELGFATEQLIWRQPSVTP